MPARNPLGTIANLWRYPIKSLAPQALERTALGPEGLAGDRASALFVTTEDTRARDAPYRGKEHNLLHTIAEPARAGDLGAERGVMLEARADGPHFDAAPLSIVVDRWVAELEGLVRMPLDPLRFRPNLFVRADPSFTESEDDLVGCTILAGDLALEVTATIKRCVTITYDIESGAPEPAVHRVLAAQRANVMGVYCRPLGEGRLDVGERLWITGALG